MTTSEIRKKFLTFFEKRGHTVISSASLVTSDEKGLTNPTLFNTAGMQPLIPYLLGKPYLKNGNEIKRLVNFQKCIRTVDIDDVGDNTHATFFEMMGNWSLGDYFKKEAIEWSYDFLTNKVEGLGLDPNRLYISVFEGDFSTSSGQDAIPKDTEAANIWSDVFAKNNVDVGGDTTNGKSGRIFYLGADKNWWEAGDNGPCGPDTEMYYDISNTFGGKVITHKQFLDADSDRKIVEVWNDVFMQYEKKDGKIIGNLPKPSVDTGAGLERLAITLQGVDNIYDIDLVKPIMDKIKELSTTWNLRSARIVADHIKASVFLIADGVLPSNSDRGYVLRKLIRRAVRHFDLVGMNRTLNEIVVIVQKQYSSIYSEIVKNGKDFEIQNIIKAEETKFRDTLKQGLKEFEKLANKDISGHDAFSLFSSYGFPVELTIELAKEKNISVDLKGFENEFRKHQELSRKGAEQKFKGGLGDSNDPMVVRYHTATHLLHQALHNVLGNNANQKGSNITAERLRFDFTYDKKMTDEQKKKVEEIVNSKINESLPMQNVVLSSSEAEKTGARHLFGEKYGDQISIYFIGQNLDSAYSKEYCGGPHVKNTSELAGPNHDWKFKIQKEEAVSAGVRRIKAVLV